MKAGHIKIIGWVAISLLLLLKLSNSASARQYAVIDIGGHTQAYGINNSGQVVGWSILVDGNAFFWDGTQMIGLGTLGGPSGYAYAINDSSQVVGYSGTTPTGHPSRAFLWEHGRMADLGVLPNAPYKESLANDINDSGQVVGRSICSTNDFHAFLWENDAMIDLGTLAGSVSSAQAINEVGQVAGFAFLAGGSGSENYHAFLWEDGIMTDLGTLGLVDRSEAFDVNDSCQVVGYSWTTDKFEELHAFLWEDGHMLDLGTLPGCIQSWARAINNLGEVVGDSCGVAFLWTAEIGMVDLNDFLPPNCGWFLTLATDINDVGQIIGRGFLNGVEHAFLLTPIPPIEIDIDIKPGSCPNPLNTKSEGVLPMAILGTDVFDVTNTDVASIRLEGVAPIRSSLEDVSTPVLDAQDECDCTTEGPDGNEDLTLKFDTQAIVAALGWVNDGDEVVLTLTGNLLDGTPIEGQDCLLIQNQD